VATGRAAGAGHAFPWLTHGFLFTLRPVCRPTFSPDLRSSGASLIHTQADSTEETGISFTHDVIRIIHLIHVNFSGFILWQLTCQRDAYCPVVKTQMA